MADIDYSVLEGTVIVLESEEGESMECQLVGIFDHNGQDYAAFTEIDNDEYEVYIFTVDAKQNKKEIEFEFSIIEDEDLLEELIGVLQRITDEQFANDEDMLIDEDSDEVEDDDEDDSKWDEFITKKLD